MHTNHINSNPNILIIIYKIIKCNLNNKKSKNHFKFKTKTIKIIKQRKMNLKIIRNKSNYLNPNSFSFNSNNNKTLLISKKSINNYIKITYYNNKNNNNNNYKTNRTIIYNSSSNNNIKNNNKNNNNKLTETI